MKKINKKGAFAKQKHLSFFPFKVIFFSRENE